MYGRLRLQTETAPLQLAFSINYREKAVVYTENAIAPAGHFDEATIPTTITDATTGK